MQVDLPIHADVKDVIQALIEYYKSKEHVDKRKLGTWLSWCKGINRKYPAVLPKYYEKKQPVNPYAFIAEFSKLLEEEDPVICGNGSACVVSFQAMNLKKGQRLFTNSGCAAMGYGFPAALGCAVAQQGKRVICLDGDGSFPSLEKLAYAYDIPYFKIENLEEGLVNAKEALNREGPVLCEVLIDPEQNFEPKLSSKVLPDGSIISPEISDMYPFLSREEFERVNKNAKSCYYRRNGNNWDSTDTEINGRAGRNLSCLQ